MIRSFARCLSAERPHAGGTGDLRAWWGPGLPGSCPDPGILAGWLSVCGQSSRSGASSGDGQLTRRERRVLQLLTSDLSERDIGHELYVSHNTIHSHVRSIYRKLGVSTRAGALKRTRELRLL